MKEHSSASPPLPAADGGSSVSREEFNVALDTLKTSMTTEVKDMLKNFLDGLKLSIEPLEVVIPLTR